MIFPEAGLKPPLILLLRSSVISERKNELRKASSCYPLSVREANISIRPAKRDDVPAIVTISRTSVSDEEVIGFGTSISESLYGDVCRLSSAWVEPNCVGSEEVLVAEADGRVVGCVKIEERSEELELVDIDVLRELQGRGIGSRLIQFVEQLARERRMRAVTLGTSRNQAGIPWRSLPWWKSRGYMVTHEEENDWTRSIGPGVREIRMRKDLD